MGHEEAADQNKTWSLDHKRVTKRPQTRTRPVVQAVVSLPERSWEAQPKKAGGDSGVCPRAGRPKKQDKRRGERQPPQKKEVRCKKTATCQGVEPDSNGLDIKTYLRLE